MATTKFKVEMVIETDFDYTENSMGGERYASNKEGFTDFIRDTIEDSLYLQASEHILSLEVTKI